MCISHDHRKVVFLWVVLMDVVDARRNLERYQNNVEALRRIHPQDLTVAELNTITVLIKKQNRLIANIQEALAGERRVR